jgi:hypothetical protein
MKIEIDDDNIGGIFLKQAAEACGCSLEQVIENLCVAVVARSDAAKESYPDEPDAHIVQELTTFNNELLTGDMLYEYIKQTRMAENEAIKLTAGAMRAGEEFFLASQNGGTA